MLKEDETDKFLRERFKVYVDGNKTQEDVYRYLIDQLSTGNYIWELGYKYLCWLHYHNKSTFGSDINKPIVPTPLELSLDDFKNKFCVGDKRNEIYLHFLGYVKARLEEFQVDSLKILIGGSFVEEDNAIPNDIDCLIIVSEEILKNSVANDYERYCVRNVMPVDVEFAVEDLTFKDYWYYTCLTHLGNKPEDKKSEYIKNHKFYARQVYSVALSYESK